MRQLYAIDVGICAYFTEPSRLSLVAAESLSDAIAVWQHEPVPFSAHFGLRVAIWERVAIPHRHQIAERLTLNVALSVGVSITVPQQERVAFFQRLPSCFELGSCERLA